MPIDRSPGNIGAAAAGAVDLSALRRRRGIIKGSCTRIETFVNSTTFVSADSRAQLQERRARLDALWQEYCNVQSQIELLDEDEVEDRIAFEDTIYSLCARLRQLLDENNYRPRERASAPGSTRSETESVSCVRLPKLSLPTFSGKYDEWFPFHDTFMSIIHSNKSLSDVQKFQYLRASLTDKALDAVKSFEISDNNYDLAWNILKERFDNKRIIVQTHIKGIFDLPVITKENASDIRQLADGVSTHIRALSALNCNADKWDALLIYIISSKLDSVTAREWHASLHGLELPTFKELTDFLTRRSQILEESARRGSAASGRSDLRPRARSDSGRLALHASVEGGKCIYCNGPHLIYHCRKFLALSVSRRIGEMRGRGNCLNCLRSRDHVAAECPSSGCRTCKLKHNTLLHLPREGRGSGSPGAGGSASGGSPPVARDLASVAAHGAVGGRDAEVLLSTAVVYVYDADGARVTCRALLDSGSQASFVSRGCLAALRLGARPVDISITGIGGTVSASNQLARVRLRSRLSAFEAELECVVTDRITERVPACALGRRAFKLPTGIDLADPRFYIPSDIDILIGAELFWQLLCVGQIRATSDHPTLQKTRVGWVLAGRRDGGVSRPGVGLRAFHASISNSRLYERISQFWRIEELGNSNGYTVDERICEEHFLNNVTTNDEGRYIVKLPLREDRFRQLGDSRGVAMKRFRGLERRLDRDSGLKQSYTQFLREYLALGHMRAVSACPTQDRPIYLPHHAVVKDAGRGSRLRVVFDASCKTSTGISLNDALRTGPVVQQDLISILIRFRTFVYVFTADIVKMYRQVLLHESQTHLQRILWREGSDAPIGEYELLTVTYGTGPASFLATRCLQHLAQRYAVEYALGSRCVLRDFYVDDLLTGANTLLEAERIREETVALLRRGRFELGKWSSNCRELLRGVEGATKTSVPMGGDSGPVILGVAWDPIPDDFKFSHEGGLTSDRITKRTILAEIASLFDPLGLLGPLTVAAKLILQDAWRSRVGWDESMPQDIHCRWLNIKQQLSHLDELRVPRFVGRVVGARGVQLHGFCDASERAYGACVYVRARDAGEWRTRLLISKSRVAPLRAISLPRLELSAALLLARLVDKIRGSIEFPRSGVVLWSDSTITLQWILSPSRRWNAFVANRVGEIQHLTEGASWRHVPSADNPADVLSRGIDLAALVRLEAWWSGPLFLRRDGEHWPVGGVGLSGDLPEQRRVVVAVAAGGRAVVCRLLEESSGLDRVLRIVAYCLRFGLPRRAVAPRPSAFHQETAAALRIVVRCVQRESFPEEYRRLGDGRSIKGGSRIMTLTPFMDEHGVIRVGGRIGRAALPRDALHPMLLPKNHRLTVLIIRREHVRNLHAGVQATMCAVRQRFWPLAARSTIRKIIHDCVVCFKCRPVASQAVMADLPRQRVTMSRPFTNTGIDYAGPIHIKESKRRNARMLKAYISVFVCFATKAVHLEIVSDLTSEAFVAALKRFMSRRGRPSRIYSDNGTTFVGANKQIKEMYKLVNSEQLRAAIRQFAHQNEIVWSFIPPHAPHFGGLWEAAVKSAKNHLYRVIGNTNLTFEEMQTLLCEIEAVLNSRPLTPLSEDPNDFECITPGHFLIGAALNSFPVLDLTAENEGRLLRWQRVEQIRQHFWKRWSTEYLHTLIERRKWKENKGEQLKVGQLVLVQQPGLGPLQWSMGRVQEIHPGADGVARAATLRTRQGPITRPLTKLAILPIDEISERDSAS